MVTGTEYLCAARSMPALRQLDVAAVGTHYELMSCVFDDCDGPTRPVALEAWLSLGELTPGSHSFNVGGHEVTVNVPTPTH